MKRTPSIAGFSMIELVLAVGIFGSVILGISTAIVTFKKTEMFRRDRLDRGIDYGFAESAVLLDLSDASPSFSFVNQPDDNNRNFFDYYPDLPDGRLAGAGVAPTRVLTLDAVTSRTFKLVVVDRTRKPGVKVNPPLAYSFSGGTNLLSASATYVGLNVNNVISDRSPPGFWRDGLGMLLISPAFLRPILPVNQTLNYGYPPKTHAMAGFIQGNDVVYRGDWDGGLDQRMALDSSRIVDSADKFLWWLPVIGGSGVYALAVPVQYIRFKIETIGTGPTQRNILVREEWDGTGYIHRFMLAENIVSVTLRRSSVASPLIGVTFVMNNAVMAR